MKKVIVMLFVMFMVIYGASTADEVAYTMSAVSFSSTVSVEEKEVTLWVTKTDADSLVKTREWQYGKSVYLPEDSEENILTISTGKNGFFGARLTKDGKFSEELPQKTSHKVKIEEVLRKDGYFNQDLFLERGLKEGSELKSYELTKAQCQSLKFIVRQADGQIALVMTQKGKTTGVKPVATPKPVEPTEAPKATETPKPTEAPKETEKPKATKKPKATPTPTPTPEPEKETEVVVEYSTPEPEKKPAQEEPAKDLPEAEFRIPTQEQELPEAEFRIPEETPAPKAQELPQSEFRIPDAEPAPKEEDKKSSLPDADFSLEGKEQAPAPEVVVVTETTTPQDEDWDI